MKCVNYKLQLVKEREVEYRGSITSVRKTNNLIKKLGWNIESEECFNLICLAQDGKVLGTSEVSRGTLTYTVVGTRELFKRALLLNAASIIVTHNHPSDRPFPSEQDIHLTERLQYLAKMLDIKMLDHIISTPSGKYFSFSANGYLE